MSKVTLYYDIVSPFVSLTTLVHSWPSTDLSAQAYIAFETWLRYLEIWQVGNTLSSLRSAKAKHS